MLVLLTVAAASPPPWWQGLLQGLAGGLLTLVGAIVTLVYNGRRERRRHLDERAERAAERFRNERVETLASMSRHVAAWTRLADQMFLDLDLSRPIDWENIRRLVQEGDELNSRAQLFIADEAYELWQSSFWKHVVELNSEHDFDDFEIQDEEEIRRHRERCGKSALEILDSRPSILKMLRLSVESETPD